MLFESEKLELIVAHRSVRLSIGAVSVRTSHTQPTMAMSPKKSEAQHPGPCPIDPGDFRTNTTVNFPLPYTCKMMLLA